MMTLKIQITLAIALILALVIIINMIRKKSLELKYALSWIFLVGALVILVFLPHLLEDMAHLLGIASPVNMIFFLGFCFALIIIFTLTVALSRLSERVRKLSQIIALNEKDFEMYTKESPTDESEIEEVDRKVHADRSRD